MSYAIITVGGKQYRVREGERLLVDRLKTDEGKTFNPRVLLIGGDGKTDLTPSTTEIKRRSPLVRNATTPSRFAKIVSSLPMPVPGPGRKRVPRWRTRIIPELTSWPANIFTPSICGFESRPFRDDPRPFLCAI